MCLSHHISVLEDAFTGLPPSKQDFAKSLLRQHAKAEAGKAKPLSAKQVHWVKKLVEGPAGDSPKTTLAVDTSGIVTLFATAKQSLKRPRIRFDLPTGEEVGFSLAGADSQNPGFIYVRVAGQYAGKVSPDGVFTPFKLEGSLLAMVGALFGAIAAAPAEVAAAYGKKTGACCFCGIEIKTAASLAVGYGPDCADHYGLPWGVN